MYKVRLVYYVFIVVHSDAYRKHSVAFLVISFPFIKKISYSVHLVFIFVWYSIVFSILWKRAILRGKGYIMVRNIVSRAMFKCCICGQAIAFGLRCFQSLDKPMNHYHTSCYEKTAMNRIESEYHVEKRSIRDSWINLSRIFKGWWGDINFV